MCGPEPPYGEEIIDGIHGARVMVLVLSANANASPHIPKEVERAVSRGIPIIPLRVEDVLPAKSLDYFISSVHWLDAITPPLESHVDSLATTIRTLLPEGSQKPIKIDPVIAPSAGAATVAPIVTAAASAKPKWLWPAVAAVVVIAAAGAWYWLGSGTGSGSGVVPVVATQPDVNRAIPPQPKPGFASPGPASPRVAPALPAPGMDPIIGCWHWMNNAAVTINPDGTMTAGPFTARWRLANPAAGCTTSPGLRRSIPFLYRRTGAVLRVAINMACP